MQGKCPDCGREYEISDDFVAMGGKAKCPHCVQDLVFPPKTEDRETRRLLDQTKIDPNRASSATRVEPDEVDARCPECNRFFKVDSQYLRMGGDAKCPHCGVKLLFDVPSQPPAPKPPEDLWSDNTSQTVELGSSGQLGALQQLSASVDDDLADSGLVSDQDPLDFEQQQDDLDPYSGTGDMELPELSGLDSPLQDEYDAAYEDVEDQGYDGQDDIDHLQTEVISSPFGQDENELIDDMPTPDEDDEDFEGESGIQPDIQTDAQSWDDNVAGQDVIVGVLDSEPSEPDLSLPDLSDYDEEEGQEAEQEGEGEREKEGEEVPGEDFADEAFESEMVVGVDETSDFSDSTKEMDDELAADLIESSSSVSQEEDEPDAVGQAFGEELDSRQYESNPNSLDAEFEADSDVVIGNLLPDDDDAPGELHSEQVDEDEVLSKTVAEAPEELVETPDEMQVETVADLPEPSSDASDETKGLDEDFKQDEEQDFSDDPWIGDEAPLSLDQDSLLLKDKQEEDSEVSFAGLASSEDWASAAAAWAESGFSSEQMPEFIKSEPPPSGEVEDESVQTQDQESSVEPGSDAEEQLDTFTRTLKDGDSLEAMRARGADAADAVDVSDADILEIGAEEIEELSDQDLQAPGTSAASSGAVIGKIELSQKSPQKEMARKVSEGKMDVQSIMGKLWNPPVLAASLGVLALLIVGLFWLLTGSEEDVENIAFPVEGINAKVVQAPPPVSYRAKESAAKHYGLGNRQAHLGHFENALEEYQKACRLDPGYPNPHRAMGSIYAALGKWKLSRTAYETYLRLAPDGPDSKQVRDIIHKYDNQ